jgi:hypothetical protein
MGKLIPSDEEDSHAKMCGSAIAKENIGADWRQPLVKYLQAPDSTTSKKV